MIVEKTLFFLPLFNRSGIGPVVTGSSFSMEIFFFSSLFHLPRVDGGKFIHIPERRRRRKRNLFSMKITLHERKMNRLENIGQE